MHIIPYWVLSSTPLEIMGQVCYKPTMDQRRALMVIGGIILCLLAIVVGVAYYSARALKNPKTIDTTTSSPVPEVPQVFSTPLPSSSQSAQQDNFKTYLGQGWSLRYPITWGLLKCNNSQNIELDPTNSIEQLGVACDFSVKPITILFSKTALNCPGEAVKLGSNTFIKSKTSKPSGDINYKWCINGGVGSLDITHRVSQSGSRATSKTDYSINIEQVLGTLLFGTGGS